MISPESDAFSDAFLDKMAGRHLTKPGTEAVLREHINRIAHERQGH